MACDISNERAWRHASKYTAKLLKYDNQQNKVNFTSFQEYGSSVKSTATNPFFHQFF